MQETKNNYAIAGLVLGILSIVLCWVPTISILALPCGIVGIILSVKGRKIEVKKSMATAGMVLSIIGLSIWAIVIVCALCAGSLAIAGIAGLAS